ncbi:HsdR family type I site-specific deoxyribonuclease [Methanonatronarchaeum sp. AMET-Sl]|uniref:type I restriction endonuclease subunit R n=1 Tax=Methanonatronarchaeum sp. AMET-Sl TaxID=3037654 RepID=UPI00244E06FC|nr:HsdR family type I site-specific deoxyribonuclease [Methanonatronarchaeum sp. AMET-Sl]WGI17138.1 HsdR family type I site-specific deoxyribonuclease [Methanonatronarchaeum sp. AMET-Sl]
MRKFDESGIEAKFLEWLSEVGWDVYGDPMSNEWGSSILDLEYDRDSSNVVYWGILREKIIEFNGLSGSEANEVVNKLKRRISSENLLEGNKRFYNLLRNGISHSIKVDDRIEERYIELINPNPKNNSLLAVSQFQVSRRGKVRPDITLFVNGVPFVNIELKSSAQGSEVSEAVKDIKSYERDEPRLFVPNLFNVACDGEKFRYAATGAPREFFFPWYSEDFDEGVYEPEDAVKDLLNPETLLDIFQYFVFFENEEAKIVPRYMQYQAANKIVDRIRKGRPRKGLIWHTQGSGKTYTMLYSAYKAKKSPDIDDAQYLVIVDREKLNDQIEGILHDIEFPNFSVAESKKNLEELLSMNKSQLILTTIHKFGDVEGEVNSEVDMETVVFADESHRFMEKKLGSKLKAALTDRFYFGFTGTPVMEGDSEKDRNTFNEFSPEGEAYLHKYSIDDGQRDGVITPVTYTEKNIEWNIPNEMVEEAMDQDYDKAFSDLPPERRAEVIKKYVNESEISELRPRLEKVVKDIVDHYTSRVMPNGFKSMVVTPSRKAAALYGEELQKYFDPEEIKVIVSGTGEDPDVIQRMNIPDRKEQQVVKEFKEEENPKFLVVCNKLLTGFDAPILKTIYLDRTLKNHNLLQAIARTNRPMKGKANGEIVDYQGVFADWDRVLEYEDIVIENAAIPTDELVEKFKNKLEVLIDIFEDFEFENDVKEFHKAIVKLEKNPELAQKFEKVYEEAQDVYESLEPHKELGKEPTTTQWEVLTQIYSRYKKVEKGENEEYLGKEVREKTRKILEEHLEVEKIKDGKTDKVPITSRDVSIKNSEENPDYGFIKNAMAKKRNLEIKREQNPAIPKLSEKVKKIIEGWRKGDVSTKKANEEINLVDEKEKNLQKEQKSLNLNNREYAIYKLLTKEFNDYVDDGDQAVEITKNIETEIEDFSSEGNIEEIKKRIRKKIIRTLADMGKIELLKADNKKFLKQSVDYIVRNKGQNNA